MEHRLQLLRKPFRAEELYAALDKALSPAGSSASAVPPERHSALPLDREAAELPSSTMRT